jgi:hypothetical protein
VTVHEQGYAEIAADELAKTGKVVLQPWGRVEGILKHGTRPAANEEVMIADAFVKDPRFVMIGLSLDAEAKEVEEFVKNRQLKWIQGFLGEWSQTKLPDLYGVSGIPATFLIGPDGRIIAKDLRGGATKDTIAKALGQEAKASAN